jgi:hypothetical protein
MRIIMANHRDCSLCGEPLEDEPAIHDVAECEKTERLKGREEIKKLKASIDFWKEAWHSYRSLVGELMWKHANCPYEIVQQGKLVFVQPLTAPKLIGAGASQEAAVNIVRLMNVPENK